MCVRVCTRLFVCVWLRTVYYLYAGESVCRFAIYGFDTFQLLMKLLKCKMCSRAGVWVEYKLTPTSVCLSVLPTDSSSKGVGGHYLCRGGRQDPVGEPAAGPRAEGTGGPAEAPEGGRGAVRKSPTQHDEFHVLGAQLFEGPLGRFACE